MKTPVCIFSLVALLGLLPALPEQVNLPDLQARVAKGDPEAELELGRAYHKGTGVPQDFAKASDLYRKAAAQGNAKAMYNLGYIYRHGQGVPEDDIAAGQWFQESADKGLPAGQLEIGLDYFQGENGLKQDYVAAGKWLLFAAQPSSPPNVSGPAANALGFLFESGAGVSPDAKQAMFWYTQAAEGGFAMAQGNLGRVYAEGSIVKKDPVQAYKWLKLGAFQGDTDAKHLISDDLAANVFTDEQKTEGDRLAAEYQRTHHRVPLSGPIPVVVTADVLKLRAAEAATKAAAAKAAAAASSSGTKASGWSQGSVSIGQ